MFYLIPLVAILGTVAAVAYKSRHKKRRQQAGPVVSSLAVVHTSLDPEGSVLVDGELFIARTLKGNTIPAKAHVRVVGFSEHLLLVEERCGEGVMGRRGDGGDG